eukprot:COSAG06_NODE_531_length_14564_cov_23.708400_4_plen_36_part_00
MHQPYFVLSELTRLGLIGMAAPTALGVDLGAALGR